MRVARGAIVAALLAAAPAAAQTERPSEQDLFGAPAETPPAPPAAPAPPPAAPEAAEAVGRLAERLLQTDNPLALGGQLYLRSLLAAQEGDPPSRWRLAAPSLVDAFLDARPSDRVRGFLLARMVYDPTQDPNATGLLGAPAPSNPRVLLDQLWIRFDAAKTAFFTVGKQHVKWGTGRFWNPTDYLHTVRRDPLSVFDPRTGITMVRVHVPWERRGWNFSGMAILEPLTTSADTGAVSPTLPQGATASSQSGTLGGVGGALRAEVVLGPSEIGLGAVLQRGHKPRFAVDASTPVGDLDVYVEAAIKTGSEVPLWRERAGASAATPLASRFETYEPSGLTPAVTTGLRWAHKYSDEDSFEVGAEYFYNHTGYQDTSIYPWLILNGAFTPFYLGRHYAGAYLFLPNPGSWNQTTFILSALVNASDRSWLLRLDHSVLLLTYLRLETFAQGHLGTSSGEFRLGISVAPQDLGGGLTTPTVNVAPARFDVGVALRVSL
jgi:hypothetical protein